MQDNPGIWLFDRPGSAGYVPLFITNSSVTKNDKVVASDWCIILSIILTKIEVFL